VLNTEHEHRTVRTVSIASPVHEQQRTNLSGVV
jgi:hypothetical protein